MFQFEKHNKELNGTEIWKNAKNLINVFMNSEIALQKLPIEISLLIEIVKKYLTKVNNRSKISEYLQQIVGFKTVFLF